MLQTAAKTIRSTGSETTQTTRAAHGVSLDRETATAAKAAAAEALAGLSGAPPRFGILFASPDHDLEVAMTTVRGLTDVDVIGCSTAGELTEKGLVHGGLVLLLVASDELVHQINFAQGLDGDPKRVAADLCRGLDRLRAEGLRDRRIHSTTILLADGLSGRGEAVVERVLERTGDFQPVVGGAAGDEGRFDSTFVGAGERAASSAAAALHLFGARAWGVGVGHGLRPTERRMEVTRADGNVVYELDGRPAFEAYVEHAEERGVELKATSAGPYLIHNELGVFSFGQLMRARAPLAVGSDGSLTCAAAIHQGSTVAILDGDPTAMVAAAGQAARDARRTLEGEAAAVLLFDCVCRGQMLGEGFQNEIDAVRDVFGEVPIAGFLTYGEIARYPGRLDGWHNATAVVVAIPA